MRDGLGTFDKKKACPFFEKRTSFYSFLTNQLLIIDTKL